MFKFIGSIFRFIWKSITWLRIAILNIIFIVFLVVVFQAFKAAPEIQIPGQTALFIAPAGNLVDQQTYNPSFLDLLTEPQERPTETNVHDLINAIRTARYDYDITGLVLRLDYMTGAGMSKIEELGQAINYFKESGKKVIAFADSMNQQQYLLASYADEVYINNMGAIYLSGFGVYRNYFKSAADKLSVKFHVFRVGQYKDAIEPFIRDDMSEASKEHIGTWLGSLWDRYTSTIEQHRNLEAGTVDQLLQNLDSKLKSVGGDSTTFAVENGLVDQALSRIELKEKLIAEFGKNKQDNVKSIGLTAYLNSPTFPRKQDSENKIGLIVATGTIVEGNQPESAIGSDSLSKLIRKAREDEELSALVVRVDSGGGSAFASEIIRDQLRVTRDEGLPIYISMGSVAASGGYWISTPATEIWSTPTTLTGSIGVFGLIPNVSTSLNKLGIYSDGVGTSDLADAYHIDRPLSSRAQKIIQTSVDNIYGKFINLVAEAREAKPEEIHKIAQGRVWSGETAKQLGLVDNLGSLHDLFESIAQEQDFSDYNVKKIVRDLSPKDQILRTLMQQTSLDLSSFTESNNALSTVSRLLNHTTLGKELELIDPQASPASLNLNALARCVECVAP